MDISIEKEIEAFTRLAGLKSEQWFDEYNDGNGNYDLWMAFVSEFLRAALTRQYEAGKSHYLSEKYFGKRIDVVVHQREEFELKLKQAFTEGAEWVIEQIPEKLNSLMGSTSSSLEPIKKSLRKALQERKENNEPK